MKTRFISLFGSLLLAFASWIPRPAHAGEFDVPVTLFLVAPTNGQVFESGTPIALRANVLSSAAEEWRVVYFANDRPVADGIAGREATWLNAPVGEHVVFARATSAAGTILFSPSIKISIRGENARTLVRIDATQRIAEESSHPYRRLAYVGEFTISRQGPTNHSLTVFLNYSGSARYGVDYPELPWLVTIPAGATSTVLRMEAKPDDQPEPIETLVASVSNCPPDREPRLLMPCFDFDIAPAHRDATVFLRDDGITEASIAITRPSNGETFEAGSPILISAVAIDLNGYLSHLDFFDGDKRIGESQLYFLVAPEPGTPIHHEFAWNGAAPGLHTLRASSTSANGEGVRSAPVVIAVRETIPSTVVRIDATRLVAEEDSLPYDRLAFWGEFTVSRTGPTNSSLTTFLRLSGTAIPGKDYETLPWAVTIPAGAASVAIRVQAIPDDQTEGLETVVAALANCPPDSDPALGIPCYFFEIDPAHGRATVFIRDDGTTHASLTLTRPADGSRFPLGQTILVEAVAIAVEGYIPRVEFFDGDRLIGTSEIHFIREPDPGTPVIHQFEWRDAAPGSHTLTAQATIPEGGKISSAPVHIAVAEPMNRLPLVTIVKPETGEAFPVNTAIAIVATARDADGYTRRAEFFADGRKIGEQTLDFIQPPPPGETQTYEFSWTMPEPGTHRLVVRVTDNQGGVGLSAVREITVGSNTLLPVVTVEARDCFASESGASAGALLNTATFMVRRHGPTNAPLTVAYSLDGTAENGVDYEKLPESVVIPAGQRTAIVLVRPLEDDVAEKYESVVLQLQPPVSNTSGQYLVGRPSKAVALIADFPWAYPVVDDQCDRLDRHWVRLCFKVNDAGNYLLEATCDLRTWESRCVIPALDGFIQYVDESDSSGARFYRITPEPLSLIATP